MSLQVHALIRFDAKNARRWVRLMRLIAPIVGRRRAAAWAWRGAARLVKYDLVGFCSEPTPRIDSEALN